MKTNQGNVDSWLSLNVRQQRTQGAPIGGEALPDNRLGRRILAKLEKKAAAASRKAKE